MEGTADAALVAPAGRQPEAAGDGGRRGGGAGAAAGPAGPAVPGARRSGRRRRLAAPQASRSAPDAERAGAAASPPEPPISESLRIDMIRLELGYGLLALAGGDGAAADRADQGPAPLHRRRDGLRAAAGAHPGQHAAWRPTPTSIRIKEIEAGTRRAAAARCCWRWTRRAALPALAGERPREPAFGLPALWIDAGAAAKRRCSAAAPWSIRRAC